jgi:drug/metabolite transporter (DMT)-like permease
VGGVLLAILSATAWGTSDFLGGLFSRGRSAIVVVLVSQTVGLSLLSVALAAFGGAPPGLGDLWPAMIGGLGLAVGAIALYQALAIGPMGVVAPVFALGAAVPVGYGLATGDRPSPIAGAGMVLAVAGCAIAARPSGGGEPIQSAGIAWALLAALAIGVSMVGLSASADANALWALETARVVAFVVVGGAAVGAHGRTLAAELRPVWPLPVVGAIEITANTAYAFASTLGLLSVVSVLASVYPVATVLLARAVLGERMSWAQGAGVAGAFAGIALLVAG